MKGFHCPIGMLAVLTVCALLRQFYTSDSWDRIDAQVSYRFGGRAQYLAALDVVNLLDKKYADHTSGSTVRNYSPRLPLSVYLTFKMDF